MKTCTNHWIGQYVEKALDERDGFMNECLKLQNELLKEKTEHKELKEHVVKGLKETIHVLALYSRHDDLREKFLAMYENLDMWTKDDIYITLGWYETELERILK